MSVGVGLIATEKVMENNQNSRNKVFDIEVDDSNPVDFAYITDYSPIEDAVILPSKYHTCLGRMRKKAPVKEIHKCCRELATARVELNGTGPLQAFEHDTRFGELSDRVRLRNRKLTLGRNQIRGCPRALLAFGALDSGRGHYTCVVRSPMHRLLQCARGSIS